MAVLDRFYCVSTVVYWRLLRTDAKSHVLAHMLFFQKGAYMYEISNLKFYHTNYIISSAAPYTLLSVDRNGLCYK